MPKTCVLFIQGGGKGAHAEDAPLANSLKRALGPRYDVLFPRMPREADPNVEAWKEKISSALSRLSGMVILVAHSVGGSILLRYLSEEKVRKPIAGLFLLAAPSRDKEQWNFDDLELPGDVSEKLALIPRIVFYHCRDDDVVPFAHLALHGARIPRAVTRAVDSGGHQFGNDLTGVATDIQGNDAASSLDREQGPPSSPSMERKHMPAVARAEMLIRSPASAVFSALVRPASLKKFWLKQASAALSKGAKVDWEFRVPGATETVEVTRFVEGEAISFVWSGGKSVELRFRPVGRSSSVVEVRVRGSRGRGAVSEANLHDRGVCRGAVRPEEPSRDRPVRRNGSRQSRALCLCA